MQKINGTFINIVTENINHIYEYNDFFPIPFRAGDILRMFLPPNDNSKLRIQFEKGCGPSNYYIPTEESVTTSPYDSIDIHRSTPCLLQSAYHAPSCNC